MLNYHIHTCSQYISLPEEFSNQVFLSVQQLSWQILLYSTWYTLEQEEVRMGRWEASNVEQYLVPAITNASSISVCEESMSMHQWK